MANSIPTMSSKFPPQHEKKFLTLHCDVLQRSMSKAT